MHPITIIEVCIAILVVLFSILIAFLVKKEWRKVKLLIPLVTIMITFSFFIFRPYWIDYQIEQRTVLLNEYLSNQYPEEQWEITSIDFRTYRQYNPYHLKVTFEAEPLITYSYRVNRKGEVRQVSFSTPDNTKLQELRFLE